MNHVQYATGSVGHKIEVNITPLERFGRIAFGLLGVVGGVILLAGSPTLLTGLLEVLLIAAGLDLVVTGATGHCPLYAKLGYTPKSLKGDSHEPGTHATHAPGHDGFCH